MTVKSLAFPVEVMMMCDGWHPGFGDKLGQSQAERYVDGNRECVLNDEDLEAKTFVKRFEAILQFFFEFLNSTTHCTRALLLREKRLLDLKNRWMLKEGSLDEMRDVRRGVQLARHKIGAAAFCRQQFGPLLLSSETPSVPANRVDTNPNRSFLRCQTVFMRRTPMHRQV